MTSHLFDYAAKASQEYRTTLEERPVAPSEATLAALAVFDEAMPEKGEDALGTLEKLHTYGSPATVATTGGRFFGFVQGGSIPVSIASDWIASTWDQNAAVGVLSPISAKLEEVAGQWTLDLLGLPAEAGFGFVSGATMGGFSALAVARTHLYCKLGYDLRKKGLRGAPPLRIIASEETHPTNIKALTYLGVGEDEIIRAPCDKEGRIIPSALPQMDERTILIAQAGNINSGASDPFTEICEKAHAAGAWVHVDGAFGAWAAATRKRKEQVEGMGLADSWSVDFHKWLNVPYASAMYACKSKEAIAATFSKAAPYLVRGELRDPSNHTPELSRRGGAAVNAWVALRHLGREGVADMIDGCCDHAQSFADGLTKLGMTVLNDVCLNQVTAIYGDEENTKELVRRIQACGTTWLGPTFWQGRHALRISVSSWATTAEDAEKSLAAIAGCIEAMQADTLAKAG